MNRAIHSAICTLLRPLVRVLLQAGISFPSFIELTKWVYVDVAARDFGLELRKQSVSRVALITGLTRKEVLRVQRLDSPLSHDLVERHNRLTRVVSGWVRDRRFSFPDGEPLALAFDGEDNSFIELVRAHSGDMTPRAVLDELIRVGMVERKGDGHISLVNRAYLPHDNKDGKYLILGSDTADLITTIDHNINCSVNGEPYFQRKVCYYSFPEAEIPEFRRFMAVKSQALLEELDHWLAERDAAAASDAIPRRRSGVSIYYFEGPPEEDQKR